MKLETQVMTVFLPVNGLLKHIRPDNQLLVLAKRTNELRKL
jgi:hypothetical protein